MPNPIETAIDAFIGGYEAETERRRLRDSPEAAGSADAPTTNFSKRAKTLRPKSYLDSVFSGFKNARLSPGERVNAERTLLLNEGTQLDMALEQQAYHDTRQGMREFAALTDTLMAIEDPEERLRLISQHSRLARTAPKQFSALQSSTIHEIQSARESKRVQRELDNESLDGRIEEGIKSSFESLAATDPVLAAQLRNDLRSGNPERSESALKRLGESQERFEGAFGDALHNLSLARRRGNPEEIELSTAALNKLTEKSGFRLEYDPSTGKMLAVQGPGALNPEVGPVPLGTKGQQQQKIIAGQFTKALVERVLPLITPDTVGPRGTVRDVVENKLLANIRELVGLPANANTDITEVKSLLTDIRSQAIKFLRTDSQMNQSELKLILPALPEFSASESSEVTRQKVMVLRDIVNLGDFLGRRGAGLPMDTFFTRMTPEDIRSFLARGVKEQVLTKAQALVFAEEAGAIR